MLNCSIELNVNRVSEEAKNENLVDTKVFLSPKKHFDVPKTPTNVEEFQKILYPEVF
jgi:hypothetical protein